MWSKYLRNERFLYFVGGIAAATVGLKVLKSNLTRTFCLKGIAKGMKLQKDMQEAFQNIKEDATDMYVDSQQLDGK